MVIVSFTSYVLMAFHYVDLITAVELKARHIYSKSDSHWRVKWLHFLLFSGWLFQFICRPRLHVYLRDISVIDLNEIGKLWAPLIFLQSRIANFSSHLSADSRKIRMRPYRVLIYEWQSTGLNKILLKTSRYTLIEWIMANNIFPPLIFLCKIFHSFIFLSGDRGTIKDDVVS